MPKIRKKSKRVITKHRVKVEKKIREHKRKVKKEAKKNPKKGTRKDPGIPNNLPFRDDVLREVQVVKEKKHQEYERKKAARKKSREKLHNQNRNLSAIVKDAKSRQAVYEKKHDFDAVQEDFSRSLNKHTENSRKTFFMEFKKVVDVADVVLEVLDARDPQGSRCLEVEELVRSSPGNKHLVLVINKIDLVPKENVEAWLKYLRQELPSVAFKASTQQQKGHLTQTKVDFSVASKDLLKSSNCLGADILMKLLANYCRTSEMSINVGVVGFPNTGKSSIINSLKRSRACNVGAVPGITKAMQIVRLDKHIKLLDSPGVVLTNTPSETAAVLRNVVKLESLEDPVPCVAAILSRCQKIQMMFHYSIPNYDDTNDFLVILARRMGHLKKGGIPDVKRAARSLLQDWNSGKITYYTAPPEREIACHHLGASIVSDWGQEFSIDQLIKEERNMMSDLKSCSDKAMLIQPFEPLKGVAKEDGVTASLVEMEEEDEEEGELEDGHDEAEEMEGEVETNSELKGVTIALESKPAKAPTSLVPDKSYRHQPARKMPLNRIGGLIPKKAVKLAEKREKKKKKKANVLAGKLSDSLTSAFSTIHEDYNFAEALDE